jgi:two-component system sensor histidine kinase HydH
MKSILIVEDERVIAASIKNILRHLGYNNTYIAESAEEAIRIIDEKHPDLVLADIVLEGEINGIELAKQIKSEYGLPVIFLTSYSDEKTVSDAKLSEPYGFITKPFKIEELKITLEIAFHKSKMEKKLIQSEEKYHLLTEAVMDVIFTLDPKGNITFLSSAFEKITGFKSEDFKGRHFRHLVEPSYIKPIMESFIRGIKGEKLPLYDIEILHKDRGKVPVEINITTFYNKSENENGMIGSLRDISGRKKSEEELRKAYALLEETQQELIDSKTLANLGEFAAGIAHEIRNPLANISALAQYSMKKFDLEKKMIHNLEAIMKSSERANNIIKELLDFAKPHTLEFEYVCIADVINKVCDLTEAKRLNHQVQCNKRCSADLPKIMVDEKLLQQALINIIMNSLDAMPKGGRLSVTARQKGDFIMIRISDTGKGIARNDIEKIFNPFFTLKHDGVGLGLSVTHRIIQSHKGKIEVKSVYNQGTKFTIMLPIVHKEK